MKIKWPFVIQQTKESCSDITFLYNNNKDEFMSYALFENKFIL